MTRGARGLAAVGLVLAAARVAGAAEPLSIAERANRADRIVIATLREARPAHGADAWAGVLRVRQAVHAARRVPLATPSRVRITAPGDSVRAWKGTERIWFLSRRSGAWNASAAAPPIRVPPDADVVEQYSEQMGPQERGTGARALEDWLEGMARGLPGER